MDLKISIERISDEGRRAVYAVYLDGKICGNVRELPDGWHHQLAEDNERWPSLRAAALACAEDNCLLWDDTTEYPSLANAL